jgi:serine/threonine protein kinase
MRIFSSDAEACTLHLPMREFSSPSHDRFTGAPHLPWRVREQRGTMALRQADPITGDAARTTWGFSEGEEIAPGRHALLLLGGGRRHEAYLAWDDELFAPVVIKILRPHCVTDPAARRQILAEARALRALQHPILPRCFEAIIDGDRPHLVLEFLDGPRLSTLLRRHGPLAVEQVLPLALQLCSALHYLARKGWVHLDVKPKNVVMGAPPRLIDFSIARTLSGARQTSGPIGTDAYMAPEQCGVVGAGEIGPAADVWGLGVSVYKAMTGSLPFPSGREDGSPEERFPQLVFEPTPFPKEIPPVLADPILSCLQPRPKDRPTAAVLAHVLQPLVAVLPKPRVFPKLRLGRGVGELHDTRLTPISRPSHGPRTH